MDKAIKVQCPAKINLDLKIINRRPDGFYNIESTMQAISLFDYLTIEISHADTTKIILSGNSNEIPYNEKNIVFKATNLFLQTTNKTAEVKIFIEKNIPVSAGLAGGSTNAAGTLLGLNEFFNNPLTHTQLHELCAQLGSDINFCLDGGCKKTFSRGEILENTDFIEHNISLIKPINLGISAKEAYTKFADKEKTSERNKFINDLEWAIIDDYKELQFIKKHYPQAIMTGSGSTYFAFNTEFAQHDEYWIKNGLKTINYGVKII